MLILPSIRVSHSKNRATAYAVENDFHHLNLNLTNLLLDDTCHALSPAQYFYDVHRIFWATLSVFLSFFDKHKNNELHATSVLPNI